jgi:hypothetical protein
MYYRCILVWFLGLAIFQPAAFFLRFHLEQFLKPQLEGYSNPAFSPDLEKKIE